MTAEVKEFIIKEALKFKEALCEKNRERIPMFTTIDILETYDIGASTLFEHLNAGASYQLQNSVSQEHYDELKLNYDIMVEENKRLNERERELLLKFELIFLTIGEEMIVGNAAGLRSQIKKGLDLIHKP